MFVVKLFFLFIVLASFSFIKADSISRYSILSEVINHIQTDFYVSDINEKGGAETVALIEAEGGQAIFIKTNVADFASVEKLMQQIVGRFGRLDIAINNAGIIGANARTIDTPFS